MASKELIRVRRRIKQIERNFQINPSLDGLTKIQEDKLRAIIVLSHAEFETYIEDKAESLADYAYQRWKQKGLVTYNMLALCMTFAEEQTNANIKNDKISTKVEMIYKKYKETILHNNGIKEADIKKLYKRLGYYVNDDFDEDLLIELDGLVTIRGSIAHVSARKSQQALDYNDIIAKITRICNLLLDFEEMLMKKRDRFSVINGKSE